MKIFCKLLSMLLFLLTVESCRQQERSYSPVSISSSSIEKEVWNDTALHRSGTSKVSSSVKRKKSLTLTSLFQQLETSSQKFVVDPSADTMLRGKEGTVLEIKANSFLLNGELCTKTVSLYLKECYLPEAMVLSDLSTLSNGRLLESGGMIHLEAFAGKQRLTLQNKTIRLKMPSDKAKPYMQLFYAEGDNKKTMNWKQASESNPQFAQQAGNKSSQKSIPRANNFLVTSEGIISVVTTVSMLENGKEKIISETSYANSELCQGKDTVSMQFEMNANGTLSNMMLPDPALNKRYTIKAHRLESMTPTSLSYYPYIAGTMRFMDCTLLLQCTTKEKVYQPMFVVSRNMFISIREEAENKGKVHVVVKNQYYFTRRNNGQYRPIEEVRQKLDSVGEELQTVSSEELQYYVFDINRLGWINCDRFYNLPPSRKTNFEVANVSQGELKLVFKTIRSVLNGVHGNNSTVFENVPANQPVTLIGIKVIEGKAQLAILNTSTSAKISKDQLTYFPVTVEELKTKVQKAL